MSLPAVPPRETPAVLRSGDRGWLAYAVQCIVGGERDGIYGPETARAIREYQSARRIAVDGIVGPQTQGKMAADALEAAERSARTPVGLMLGQMMSESGGYLAAVNWSTSDKTGHPQPGVDCGLNQQRVYGAPYNLEALKSAFDPKASATNAIGLLRRRAFGFGANPQEREWRLATMAHNWPHAGGADYIAVHGTCSNPKGRCSWVPRDNAGRSLVRFPDGAPVETRWEWCQFYAMGSSHGEAACCRFVKSWAT